MTHGTGEDGTTHGTGTDGWTHGIGTDGTIHGTGADGMIHGTGADIGDGTDIITTITRDGTADGVLIGDITISRDISEAVMVEDMAEYSAYMCLDTGLRTMRR